MCRNISEGGRRCPSCYDPLKKAQANKRRRENRKLKRQQELAAQVEHNTVEESNLPQVSNQPLQIEKELFLYSGCNIEILDKDGESSVVSVNGDGEKLLRFTGDVEYNDDLKITKHKLSGLLTDIEYFSNQRISGVIDTSKLTEDSYKEFGFSSFEGGVVTSAYTDTNRSRAISKDSIVQALSRMEIDDLDNDKRSAVYLYSSENYEWINRALYQRNWDNYATAAQLKEEEDVNDSYDEEDDYYSRYMTDVYDENSYDGDYNIFGDIPDEYISREFLKATFKHIDGALEYGPKHQRVVYRGLKTSTSIARFDGFSNVEEWIDNRYKIGSEVFQEGYNSTTLDVKMALNRYTMNDSVLFEILTPEGINIASNSDYEEEAEVLLPRQQRYVVVGVHKNIEYTPQEFGKPNAKNIHIIQMVAINSQGEILDGSNSDEIESIV